MRKKSILLHSVTVLQHEDLFVRSDPLETYGKSRSGYGRVTRTADEEGLVYGRGINTYVSENNMAIYYLFAIRIIDTSRAQSN